MLGIKITMVLFALAISNTTSEDIESELMKGVAEAGKKVKHKHKVRLPSSASYKNEDDDIPDVDSLPEDSHPDKVRFEDDIILEKEKDAKLWKLLRLPGFKDLYMTKISSAKASVRAVVTGPVNTIWPKAVVPFYIDKSRRHDTERILRAVRHIEKRTCIRFPRLYHQHWHRNYIQIVKGAWASSRLGIYPHHRPQKINLHNGFMKGNLIHEFMHALGFLHEHSRPDRGKYLLLPSKIKKRWNFKRADLRGLKWDRMGIPYDYASITHYSAMSMTPRDPRARDSMGQRYSLTEKDICQLNRMYKCHKKLDKLGINCDCLDSYMTGTCKWLKDKGMCVTKKRILDFICPKTCGVCCQSKCEQDFHKVGCFSAERVPVHIDDNLTRVNSSIFFDHGGTCSVVLMKGLDKKICSCAKVAKENDMKFFTLTQSGSCIAKKRHDFKVRESEYCRNTLCNQVQYSNVRCVQGEPHSMFLYKLKN
uniref:Metalloendopeptidase n=1 Tax=Pachycerianthus maua TaxID=2736681 RepID=A0A7G7WYU1_9CNID|nr:toxin candidate TRINITY_DN40100_c3_g1_i1 [Pachycerianthus maua]